MSSGMNIDQLTFDTANPNDNQNVGAYVRAGSDGDQIASQTIAAEEWLNVAAALHAGDGTAITQSGGALDVNVASGDINIEIDYEYAEDSAAAGGEIGAYVLAVRQDTLASSTSADGDFASFKVDSLGRLYVASTVSAPNTGTSNGSITVDTTAGGTAIPTTALSSRQYIMVQNLGGADVFLGFGTVTTANGIKLANKSSFGPIDLGPGLSLKGITSSGTADVRYMEVA